MYDCEFCGLPSREGRPVTMTCANSVPANPSPTTAQTQIRLMPHSIVNTLYAVGTRMNLPRWLTALAVCLALVRPAAAHLGTDAVFAQANAGPYPIYVTITPPAVIPGEATVSVLANTPGVQSISVQANVLGGNATQYMPAPIALTPGPAGSHEFHGTVWLMTEGSWQVRVSVTGPDGPGSLAIPVSAVPTRLLQMSRLFSALLIALGALLIAGFAAIASAFASQAQSEPGTGPGPSNDHKGRRAAAFAVLGCALLLFAGNRLWKEEITRYTGNIYRPLGMSATLENGLLHLQLQPPTTRRLDDLILDHKHLMHLYLVRWPAMDEVMHLHPTQTAPGRFDLVLPTIPAGDYRLFADIVHADGFPETAVTSLYLDGAPGHSLTGDDAGANLPPITAPAPARRLPDGSGYILAVQSSTGVPLASISANVPVFLRFSLLDPQDRPAAVQPYMGMAGHVAVIKQDGSVFAHIHPNGSPAMAASMLANPAAAMAESGPISSVAVFPFGFPSPGAYRLIVQMKQAGTVETGVFDIAVH